MNLKNIFPKRFPAVVFLTLIVLMIMPSRVQACQLCALIMKVARLEQEARAAEARGAQGTADSRRKRVNTLLARCVRKFENIDHGAALAAKTPWMMPAITSGGDLVDPTDPSVSGDPSGGGRSVAVGGVGMPGTNVTVIVGLALHLAEGVTCNYRIEVTSKPGTPLPAGFTILDADQTVQVTGTADPDFLSVPVRVAIGAGATPGSFAQLIYRVTKLETGGVLQSNTQGFQVYVPDPASTNKLKRVLVKTTTKFLTLGSHSTTNAMFRVENSGGDSVDLRIEIGPSIDPASKSFYLDGSQYDILDTFLAAQTGLGPQLAPEADTLPGAQSYAVSVPAGGGVDISVAASTEEMCEFAMLGCCPFRVKLLNPAERPTDPEEVLVIPAPVYILNVNPVADDAGVAKIGIDGVADFGGQIELSVLGETVTLDVPPGRKAPEVCNDLATLVNAIPGRFTNDQFRVNAIMNITTLEFSGVQPSDVNLVFPFGPIPGLTLFREDIFDNLTVTNLNVQPGPPGLYEVNADVIVAPGPQPPQQPIRMRVLVGGATLANDVLIDPNTLDPSNPTVAPVQFFTPMGGPDNSVVVLANPDGVHAELSGQKLDNFSQTQLQVFNALTIAGIDPSLAQLIVQGQPNALIEPWGATQLSPPDFQPLPPFQIDGTGTGQLPIDTTAASEHFFKVKPLTFPRPDFQGPPGPFYQREFFYPGDPSAIEVITNFTVGNIQPPELGVNVEGINPIAPGLLSIVLLFDTSLLPPGMDPLGFTLVPQPTFPFLPELELQLQALVTPPPAQEF